MERRKSATLWWKPVAVFFDSQKLCRNRRCKQESSLEEVSTKVDRQTELTTLAKGDGPPTGQERIVKIEKSDLLLPGWRCWKGWRSREVFPHCQVNTLGNRRGNAVEWTPMSFGIDDFHDLVRLLELHPEWRADLRRLVLTEELLALPEQVARFRADTERRFQELAEAQSRTDEHIATLTRAIAALTNDLRGQKIDIGDLKGELLELRYGERAPAYVGRLIRRAQVLSAAELAALLEDAVDHGRFTEEEKDEVLLADLVVRGRSKQNGSDVYLVVEVSWGVGPHDVERAVQRAALLSKLGIPALPVVAGKTVTPQADRLAQVKQVSRLIAGQAPTTESPLT